MAKVGKQSHTFENVYLANGAVVVGPKEYAGPIGKYFDRHYDDLRMKQASWEQAEMLIYREAFELCLLKNNIKIENIDNIISGDLNNQIIIGNYVMRDYDVSYLGIFNACSSSVEGLILASNLIEANNARDVVVNISSHNATAERQFRYPTEYGGPNPKTLTATVTAGTSVLVTRRPTNIKISKATVGRVIDAKLKDPLDMGRAMAPSAYYTINQHFADFKVDKSEYDLIITGDLSYYGKDMLIKIFKEYNIDLTAQLMDCGEIIYNRDWQHVNSGGSGCGCLPAVLISYVVKKMVQDDLHKVLVVATGALLNPVIMAQKETIPAISHAIVLERIS